MKTELGKAEQAHAETGKKNEENIVKAAAAFDAMAQVMAE